MLSLVRERLERWLRRHPTANLVLVVPISLGLAGFAAVRGTQLLDSVGRGFALLVGLSLGLLAAALSYRAGFVQRWKVGAEERMLLQGLYALSALAAIVLFKGVLGGAAREAASGFVFVVGLWILPAAWLARRLRREDPQAAEEMYERSKEMMGR
jgi:hypothetical protein